jgi:hypothetical protein
MSWQRSIQAAVKALKKEEQSLVKQLDHLRARMGELTGLAKSGRGGAGAARRAARGNRLSEEGRRAISLAAKRRWAKYRAKKGK